MGTAPYRYSILASLSLLAVETVCAQEFPPLSQHIADCENKWVLAANTQSPDARVLGYVYVDSTAGVTLELHGDVELAQGGALIRRPSELEGKARLILRIDSNIPVACLSDEQAAQVGLPREWEFREIYKDPRPPGPHYTSWASHINQIGASERALELVKLARAESYSSPKLELEEGYALNALGRYDEAIGSLRKAAQRFPDDVEIAAELAYGYLSLHQYPQAIELYRRALSLDTKHASSRRWQFASNIARAYEQLGDTKRSGEWLERSAEWKKQQEQSR
jgi:tetratricopeptide (TPR) repeat protein